MGAGASVAGPPSSETPANDAKIIKQVNLKALPEAIEEAVNVQEKWPLIIDTADLASRFLRYQRGPFLYFERPMDMQPESLRRALVGALKNGSTFVISFQSLQHVNLAQFFDEKTFPRAVMDRYAIFQEETWSKLLRPKEGDPEVHDFMPRHEFVIALLTHSDHVPPETTESFIPIRVSEKQSKANDGGDGQADDDIVADACGAKEVKRHSAKLVEAAFDGEVDEVTSWLEKGYYVDSCDGRKNTALSEAACQGHDEVVRLLLQQGADPNALNDTGKSPLYRACYNGHRNTVQLLLEAGADPDNRDKVSFEGAYDVAKTDEVRALIQGWDRALTQRLKDQRRQEIQRKVEERIRTAVDRETYARMKIREELIDKTKRADLEGVKQMLLDLASEAERGNEKPRGTAEVRDERGQSLLSLCAEHNHVELAQLLLTHWKECDKDVKDLLSGALSMEAQVFKTNPNSRDLKGWNCAAIAVFHKSKDVLRLLLEHGADPTMKSHYHKSAVDLAQDELDAAGRVVRSNAEIRQVLIDWEIQCPSQRAGLVIGEENGGVPKEGTATMLAIEFAGVDGEGKKCKKAKGAGGGGKKAPAAASSPTKSKVGEGKKASKKG